MNTDLCPLCETGNLAEEIFSQNFRYRGVDLRVDGLNGLVCSECGERTLLADHVKFNSTLIARAKRVNVDLRRMNSRYLSSAEIRAVRERLELTQAEAARAFGGGPNAFSKYERGEVIQSEPMDILLRLASECGAAKDWLWERAGLKARPSAGSAWESLVDATKAFEAYRPLLSQKRFNDLLTETAINDKNWFDVADQVVACGVR